MTIAMASLFVFRNYHVNDDLIDVDTENDNG